MYSYILKIYQLMDPKSTQFYGSLSNFYLSCQRADSSYDQLLIVRVRNVIAGDGLQGREVDVEGESFLLDPVHQVQHLVIVHVAQLGPCDAKGEYSRVVQGCPIEHPVATSGVSGTPFLRIRGH